MPTDWEHETRRLLYVTERGSFARLPAFTRAMAAMLLKVMDDSGCLIHGSEDPVCVLWRAIGAHRGERRLIRSVVEQLLEDEFLIQQPGVLMMRNFVQAQYPDPTSARRISAERRLAETLDRGRRIFESQKVTPIEKPVASDTGSELEASRNSAGTELEVECKSAGTALELSASPRIDSTQSGIPSFLPKNTPLPPKGGMVLVPDPTPTKRKRRAPPVEGAMPFTIAEMLSLLAQHAKARFIIAPFDQNLSKPLTAVIRSLAADGVSLEDMTLVSKWVGAGGNKFMTDGISLTWLAKPGNLADLVGKARVALGSTKQRAPASGPDWEAERKRIRELSP